MSRAPISKLDASEATTLLNCPSCGAPLAGLGVRTRTCPACGRVVESSRRWKAVTRHAGVSLETSGDVVEVSWFVRPFHPEAVKAALQPPPVRGWSLVFFPLRVFRRATVGAAEVGEPSTRPVTTAQVEAARPSGWAMAFVAGLGFLVLLDALRSYLFPIGRPGAIALAASIRGPQDLGRYFLILHDMPWIRLILAAALLLRLPKAWGIGLLEASLTLDRCRLRLDDEVLESSFGPWGPTCRVTVERRRIAALWEEGGELVALVSPEGAEVTAAPMVVAAGPQPVLAALAEALAESLGISGSAPSFRESERGMRDLRCPGCAAPIRVEASRKECVCPQCRARLLLPREVKSGTEAFSTRILVRDHEGRPEIRVDHGREATFVSRSMLAWETFRERWEIHHRRLVLGLVATVGAFLTAPLAAVIVRTGDLRLLPGFLLVVIPTVHLWRKIRPDTDSALVKEESWQFWNGITSLVVEADGSWSLWRENRRTSHRTPLGTVPDPSFSQLGRVLETLRIEDSRLRDLVGEILLPTEHARRSGQGG